MDKGTHKLFEATEINGIKLANRFVRSATWEGMAAENGACTPGIVELMARLTRGGVGLIITSHSYIRPDGQAGPRQLGIYEDELLEGLKEMTRSVHDHGSRIVLISGMQFYDITVLEEMIFLHPLPGELA